MKAEAQAPRLTYALVTPAHNEEQFIELTLQSVIRQTQLPLRWVIVSDGSTDGTERIVRDYAERFQWIELLRVEDSGRRSFARKARAFNLGCANLREVRFDIVGNLDADLSFDEEYFAFLLQRFAEMPDLGVAGAPALEGGVHYDYRFSDIHHVTGCCQLFRRACLEEIGGYAAIEGGGIDSIAVMAARMRGWTTRTFLDHPYVHHRVMGSAGRRSWEIWFRRGEEDHALGGDPLWQLARTAYQSTSRPYVIGGLLLLSGYAYRAVTGATPAVPHQLVEFRRAEQKRRLQHFAAGLLPWSTGREKSANRGEVSIDESSKRLERWVEAHEYKGYEPFDGLSSSLRPLSFGNQFLEQVLQQVVRQSPLNLRPLLGIRPLESTKGRGYMAWGYLAAWQRTGDEEYRDKAIACLDWLMRNKSPLHPDYSWGNHFDYASRAGQYSKQESIIVWTALIGQAFLDGYEQLGVERYLDVVRSICNWILKLPRETSASGTCLSYLSARQSSIHNANLLGAAILARTARHTRSAECFEVARAAVEYSCSRQLREGAWYYGETPHDHWIDNFHTGYNLDSIRCYIESTGEQTFQPQLDLGYRYFKTSFFEPDGRPKYYHDRAYPIDIQCAAQGIETLAKFADDDPEALPTAVRVARWTIRNMQDPSGSFYYRRYPLVVAKTPMLHWGQATMFRALTFLSLQLEREAAAVGALPTDG